MVESIYLEIETNDNCGSMPMQLFEVQAEPVPIARMKLFEPDRPHGVYEVTGWTSEDGGTPCLAMYAPVSDSGQAVAHLVCGGDWGIRFKPEGSDEPWDVNSSNQWGEPYTILTDREDILLDM